MKRWFANYLLRWAFQVFRRYHGQLPKELNGIIWSEMTRKSEPLKDYSELFCSESENGLCSMCVSEFEEDQASYATVQRWLKGELDGGEE